MSHCISGPYGAQKQQNASQLSDHGLTSPQQPNPPSAPPRPRGMSSSSSGRGGGMLRVGGSADTPVNFNYQQRFLIIFSIDPSQKFLLTPMYLKPTLILLKVYAFHHYIHVSGIDNINKFAKVIKTCICDY